ncbi:MAG: hypothetical protein AB7N24_17965 [Dehalococcoidia bacterium]
MPASIIRQAFIVSTVCVAAAVTTMGVGGCVHAAGSVDIKSTSLYGLANNAHSSSAWTGSASVRLPF